MFVALAAQALAGVAVFGIAILLARTAVVSIPLMGLLAGQGVVAAILGSRFGLAAWWIPIQLVLPSGVAVVLLWQLPAWVLLVAFLVLLLAFWNSARGGVPLYLTNAKTKSALAGLLPKEAPGEAARPGVPPENKNSGEPATGKDNNVPGFRFADLGSGLGGPVLDLANRRPDGHFTGCESAPILFLLGWLRWLAARPPNARLRLGNFWTLDLGDYDVVYAFLSPVPMPELFEKAKSEMKTGSLLISNSFPVPGHPADETVEIGDGRKTRLHLWRM